MWWSLVIVLVIVGVLGLVIYTPKKLYEGVMLMQYGAVPEEERFRAWIPVYNVVKAEKIYKGNHHCFILPCYLALVVAIAIRIVTIFVVKESMIVALVSAGFVLFTILLAYVANATLVWSIMHDAGCVGFAMQIVYTLVYPLGQDYIGKFLPANVAYAMKKRKTF